MNKKLIFKTRARKIEAFQFRRVEQLSDYPDWFVGAEMKGEVKLFNAIGEQKDGKTTHFILRNSKERSGFLSGAWVFMDSDNNVRALSEVDFIDYFEGA